jgi:hypothetical protein
VQVFPGPGLSWSPEVTGIQAWLGPWCALAGQCHMVPGLLSKAAFLALPAGEDRAVWAGLLQCPEARILPWQLYPALTRQLEPLFLSFRNEFQDLSLKQHLWGSNSSCSSCGPALAVPLHLTTCGPKSLMLKRPPRFKCVAPWRPLGHPHSLLFCPRPLSETARADSGHRVSTFMSMLLVAQGAGL